MKIVVDELLAVVILGNLEKSEYFIYWNLILITTVLSALQ